MGIYILKDEWNNIFTGNNWEICTRTGKINAVEDTDDYVKRAKKLIFPNEVSIQEGELCHGIFLEDCSIGWAFTQENFWIGADNGYKDSFPYASICSKSFNINDKEASNLHLVLQCRKNDNGCQGMFEQQETQIPRYKLEARNEAPIIPEKVIEKIANYWGKILDCVKNN